MWRHLLRSSSQECKSMWCQGETAVCVCVFVRACCVCVCVCYLWWEHSMLGHCQWTQRSSETRHRHDNVLLSPVRTEQIHFSVKPNLHVSLLYTLTATRSSACCCVAVALQITATVSLACVHRVNPVKEPDQPSLFCLSELTRVCHVSHVQTKRTGTLHRPLCFTYSSPASRRRPSRSCTPRRTLMTPELRHRLCAMRPADGALECSQDPLCF